MEVIPFHFCHGKQRVLIVQTRADSNKMRVVGEGVIICIESVLRKAMSSLEVKGKRYLLVLKGSRTIAGVVRVDVEDGLQEINVVEYDASDCGSKIRFVTYAGMSASEILDDAVENGDGAMKMSGIPLRVDLELGYSDTCAIEEKIEDALADLDKFW